MRSLWCAIAVILAVAAGPARADMLLAREGELADSDSRLADGRNVDWYRLDLVAGTRYLFGATSSDVDTALVLRFADGATMANDDFSGSDPAIVYSSSRAETVELGVTTSSGLGEGGYSVSVRSVTAARSIQVGQKVTRTLGAVAEALAGGGQNPKVDSFTLSGARGDRVTLRLASSDFDTHLRIQSRDGLTDENDDSGEGTDSELSYVFPQRGQIEVVVRAVESTQGGGYVLSIEKVGTVGTVESGRPVDGKLGEGSADYLLDGRKGQAVIISVESEGFDPFVTVMDRAGRRSTNDDYGESTDSRLHYVFPDDGGVLLTVTRPESEDSEPASYRLAVTPTAFRATDYAMGGRTLVDGATLKGYLDATHLRRENRYSNRYIFTAEENELVRLELTSESFDAYLEVAGPNGFEASDDDSLGNYDSLLELVCPDAGEYVVSTTTANDWNTGFYQLAFVRKGLAEPALDVAARLETRDERDIGGRYFDVYVLDVEEGGTLTVDMTSEDFDAFLYVWDPSGDEIYEDDDSGGDTNARASVSDATAGTWTVYATSIDRGTTGAYHIRAFVH